MTEFIKWCNENQGFLSGGLSLVAIFAAIGIPAYVAHRQNKIALFDKRFEVYLLLLKIDTYYHSIRLREFKEDPHEDSIVCLVNWIYNVLTNSESLKSERILIGLLDDNAEVEGANKMDIYKELVSIISGQKNELQKGAMLFKGLVSSNLKKLADTYWEFLHSLILEYINPSCEHDLETKCEAFKNSVRKIARLMFLRNAVHKQLRY